MRKQDKELRELVIEQFNGGIFVDPKSGAVVWQVTSWNSAIYRSERNGFARESFIKWFKKFDAKHGPKFKLNLIDRTDTVYSKVNFSEKTHDTTVEYKV